MVWRHVIRRDPLAYEPQLWGMVFPLCMYTTCTYQLSRALDFEFLLTIPRVFVFVAAVAWIATLAGLLNQLVRRSRDLTDDPPAAKRA